MERDDEQIPERQKADLPVTSRITNEELQAVIRRAVELQSGSEAQGVAGEGVSEVEAVRIGQELGLDPATLRLAMAEVRGRPESDGGTLTKVVGKRTVRAARVVSCPAPNTTAMLDEYLRTTEFMVAQRRFPTSTRYARDASIAAGLGRFARGFTRAQRPINVAELDVAVATLDEESCLLTLSADLGAMRGGLLAGVLGSGAVLSAGWVVTVWATTIADPLMLLGIPLLAGSWLGMRAIYGTIRRSLQDKLESLLDRVEHDELK
jgi:hypothetical protein